MLKTKDPAVFKLIKAEEKRQREVLEMIPSENYASKEVLEALGTVLNNKYSEGYAHARYYAGQINIHNNRRSNWLPISGRLQALQFVQVAVE